MGLIPIQAIHLKVRPCHPYGSLPTLNVLWFCDVSPFFTQQEFQNVSFYCSHQQWDFYWFTAELLCTVHVCASSSVLIVTQLWIRKEKSKETRSSSFKEKSKYKSVHYNVFEYLYKANLWQKKMRRFIVKRSRTYNRTTSSNCILWAGEFRLWKRSPSLARQLKWTENSVQLRIGGTDS